MLISKDHRVASSFAAISTVVIMVFLVVGLASCQSAGYHAPETSAPTTGVLETNYCQKSPSVVDGAIVIRGGSVNTKTLTDGGDVDGAGYMTDLSVNCSGATAAANTAANRALYIAGIPNPNYGVTSAKKICQQGGYIKPTPYPGHPYHCTVWHLKPKTAASLFTQY